MTLNISDKINAFFNEIASYFVIQTPTSKVRGHCNKCGTCCKNIVMPYRLVPAMFSLLKLFIPFYRNLTFKGYDANGNSVFMCNLQNKDNTCSIYEKRPSFCRKYPSPEIFSYTSMPDECGYRIINPSFRDFLPEDDK